MEKRNDMTWLQMDYGLYVLFSYRLDLPMRLSFNFDGRVAEMLGDHMGMQVDFQSCYMRGHD